MGGALHPSGVIKHPKVSHNTLGESKNTFQVLHNTRDGAHLYI